VSLLGIPALTHLVLLYPLREIWDAALEELGYPLSWRPTSPEIKKTLKKLEKNDGI